MRFLAWSKPTGDSPADSPPTPRGLADFEQEVARAGVAVEGGVLRAGAGVKFTRSGETITVTPGPFAHTGELINGYAILEVKSSEEAVEWGKRFFKATGQESAYIVPLVEN